MTAPTLPAPTGTDPSSPAQQWRDRLITTATAETPLGQRARVLCAELDDVIRDLHMAERMPHPGRWRDDLCTRKNALLTDLRALLRTEERSDDRDR